MQSKLTVVVGGGQVAHRKVDGLLASEAQVRVISPVLTAGLQSLAEAGMIQFEPRPYQNGDLEGIFLAIAATNDTQVNQAVWAEAQARGCLINVVDDPEHSTFILPAIVHRGDLKIAVTTGGSSPALARRLREKLEGLVGPEYETLNELLEEIRPEMKTLFPPGDSRLQAALRIIDSDILQIIKSKGKTAAIAYAREQLHQS